MKTGQRLAEADPTVPTVIVSAAYAAGATIAVVTSTTLASVNTNPRMGSYLPKISLALRSGEQFPFLSPSTPGRAC